MVKAASISPEWNYTVNPSPRSDQAYAVAVDSLKNIIVVGYDDNTTVNNDYQWRIMKFDPEGNSIWNYTINISDRYDRAYGVAVDSDDSFTVVGYSTPTASISETEWIVMKFDENNNLLWNKTINTSASAEIANGVAVDSDKNIIVVGYDTDTTNADDQWKIMKFDPDGTSIWNYTANPITTDDDWARGVAVDSDKNIIVAGYDADTTNFDDQWRIMKFDPDGNSLWNYTVNPSTARDQAYSVAVDSDKNIIVVGYDTDTPEGYYQWRIMKFDPDGNSLWNYTANPSTNHDQAYSVAVDSDKNIIAVGTDRNTTSPGGGYQWRIMKFGPDGVSLWNYTYDPTSSTDQANGVAVDSSKNIIAVGWDYESGNYQWVIMKFKPNMPDGYACDSGYECQSGLCIEGYCSSCNYPDTGNWVISDTRICVNETIIMNGNVTVQSGGNLTFMNITLKFNNTHDEENGISVQSGGKMFIYDLDNDKDTTNDASNITALNTSNIFFFIVSGSQFEMKNSHMSWYGLRFIVYTSGAIITGNTFDNNIRALQIRDTTNCIVANNTVQNSTYYGQAFGLLIVNYPNYDQRNILADNILINNDHNIHTCNGAENNTITRNSITGGYYGIYLHAGADEPPSYNKYTYNNINSVSICGIHLEDGHNNTFANSSVINSGQCDYNLTNAGTTNNFINMNWTAPRTICFADTTSWFNYNNRTDIELWLKTNVSSAAKITRKLINWNQNLIQWNASADSSITARYNITGLKENTDYDVYDNNNPISGSPFDSGSAGEITFTIDLPLNEEHEIKVEEAPEYYLIIESIELAYWDIGQEEWITDDPLYVPPLAGDNRQMATTVNFTNSTPVDTCLVRTFNSSDSYSNPSLGPFLGTIQKVDSQMQCYREEGMEYWRNPGPWNVSVDLNGLVVEESTVGYWKFENNMLDSSMYSNDGSCTDCPSSTTGKFGSAYDFDGINDYVDLNDAVKSLLGTSYTVEAWINTNTVTGNKEIAVYRSTTEANPVLFQLDQNNADARFIVRDDSGNIATASKTNALSTGTWYHVVGVRNGSNVYVYVNGIKGTSASNTFGVISPNSLNIGALTVGTLTRQNFFNGIIDEVRIYNWALTSEEINASYHSGIASNFTSKNFTYTELYSLDINVSYVNFTGFPGETVNSTSAYPLSMSNTGNVELNVSMNGTDFRGETYTNIFIDVENISYNETEIGKFVNLTEDYSLVFSSIKPTEEKYLYFRDYIPIGFIAQFYNNTIGVKREPI